MQLSAVDAVLASAGLAVPALDVLVANEANYTVLLLQPLGHIEANDQGVRNRDRSLADRQFGRFLRDAQETSADLVITPEYAMPWETLAAAISKGVAPAEGKLWALGCESIKYSELESMKEKLSPHATILFETLPPDSPRFTDPLTYVFRAPTLTGDSLSQLVLLVQFKTSPMGDLDHFEVNGLQRGQAVYVFGGTAQPLRLLSLICSDAFAFKDSDALAVHDRTLVIHVQLNPKPRQTQYRQYRERLLQFKGDATELICVNWAKDVSEWCGEVSKPWNNIAASAWYLRPDGFDERDEPLCANHRRGLYYTRLESLRSHVLFFNFAAGTYRLIATKVAHLGVPASISHRRGPQLIKTCTWDETSTAWVEEPCIEDGFSDVVAESELAKDELIRLHARSPLEVERVLALCAGEIDHGENWHKVRHLDSCAIESSEIIRRITFCQDTDVSASRFRIRRLKRCGNLWRCLETDAQLQPALADIAAGFSLGWSPEHPHQNVISSAGKRATVIYMGEDASDREIDATFRRAADYLRRSSHDPDSVVTNRQRLAVLYRRNGAIKLWEEYRYVKIDRPGDTSEVDIGRET